MTYRVLLSIPRTLWANLRWLCAAEALESEYSQRSEGKRRASLFKIVSEREELADGWLVSSQIRRGKTESLLRMIIETERLPREDPESPDAMGTVRTSLLKTIFESERLEEALATRKTNAMRTHHASFLESILGRESLSKVETTEPPRESLIAWLFRHENLDDSPEHPTRVENSEERS